MVGAVLIAIKIRIYQHLLQSQIDISSCPTSLWTCLQHFFIQTIHHCERNVIKLLTQYLCYVSLLTENAEEKCSQKFYIYNSCAIYQRLTNLTTVIVIAGLYSFYFFFIKPLTTNLQFASGSYFGDRLSQITNTFVIVVHIR